MNVGVQLLKIHLASLNIFLEKIVGSFFQFGEGSGVAGEIVHRVGAVSIDVEASPVLEYPRLQARFPARAGGYDMAFQAEGSGIDFVNAHARHDVRGLIEIFEVVNAVVQPVGPLVAGVQKGLRGAAFNLVVDCVLTPVGFGNPVVIEGEQAPADQQTGGEDRHTQAIHADAAGLESRNLVILSEHAQHDQHGSKHAHRREVVDKPSGKVEVVLENHGHGDAVLDDVAEQFEEGEDVRHHHEGGERKHKVKQKAADHVGIDHLGQQREARSPFAALHSVKNAGNLLAGRAHQGPQESADTADVIAIARRFQAHQHGDPEYREDHVRKPQRQADRQGSLRGELHQTDHSQVVNESQRHGEDIGRRTSRSA